MCCFAGFTGTAVRPPTLWERLLGRTPEASHLEVSGTSIFARMESGGSQVIAYAMRLTVPGDVAMILPLPVRAGSGDDAVAFVSLEEHPRFFADLDALFVPVSRGLEASALSFAPQSMLAVHDVGAFEASYVPSMRDFDRLDGRFRIDDSVWEELGAYDDYGFAVFRLKPMHGAAVHPMAFRFPTRDAARLFFPTVHVHDGRAHPTAHFDHRLTYDPGDVPVDANEPARFANGDERSARAPVHAYAGIVTPGRLLARRTLAGELPNGDTWIVLDEQA